MTKNTNHVGAAARADRPSDWSKPKTVSQLDLTFGATGSLIGNYLPKKEEIPGEFWRGHTLWNDLVGKWFFRGLDQKELPPIREGIDKQTALLHLQTCLGSFEPKHEHKEAGCAYLMSLWFQDLKASPVSQTEKTTVFSREKENSNL